MSKEKLSVLLDNNANIIEFKDPSSISGYHSDEVLNNNWFDIFIHDADKDEVMAVFSSLIYEDLPHWSYDNRIICKNGDKKLLHFKNQILKNTDGETKYVSFYAIETNYKFLSVEDL